MVYLEKECRIHYLKNDICLICRPSTISYLRYKTWLNLKPPITSIIRSKCDVKDSFGYLVGKYKENEKGK